MVSKVAHFTHKHDVRTSRSAARSPSAKLGVWIGTSRWVMMLLACCDARIRSALRS